MPGVYLPPVKAMSARAPYYPYNLCGGDAADTEFTGNDLATWTKVEDSSPVLTYTETNDRLSIKHPGGDASAEFHALVKARSVASNDWIEVAWQQNGEVGAYSIVGLLFADGNTFGAGSQYAVGWSPTENGFIRSLHTNYSSSGGAGSLATLPDEHFPRPVQIYRFMYEGSNVYKGYVSPDGINYVQVFTETSSHISSRTHMGFYVTSWGGTHDMVYSFLYARFGNGAPA